MIFWLSYALAYWIAYVMFKATITLDGRWTMGFRLCGLALALGGVVTIAVAGFIYLLEADDVVWMGKVEDFFNKEVKW